MVSQPLYAFETRLTIPRDIPSPAPSPAGAADAEALALSALGWLLADDARRDRLLALTGLTPDGLRARLGDASVLGAVLDFLMSHEPDLVAAADALGVAPEVLARARERLPA